MKKGALAALSACAVIAFAAVLIFNPFRQASAEREAPADAESAPSVREDVTLELLRQKLRSGVSEIVIPGGTYTLLSPLEISCDVSVITTDGSTAELLVGGPFRHAIAAGECRVEFENIVFDGKDLGGGGLEAPEGIVELTNCAVINNESQKGGGILASSVLLKDCEISCNLADYGGGIHAGYLEMSGCAVFDNTALEGSGGGLYVVGSAKAENSTVYGNTAGKEGGGAFFESDCTLTHCSFTANRAEKGGGAAFQPDAHLKAMATLIAGNVQVDEREVVLPSSHITSKYSIVTAGYSPDKIFVLDSTGTPVLTATMGTYVVEILKGGAADDKVPEILLPRDQNGLYRPLGPYADIGAAEAVTAR